MHEFDKTEIKLKQAAIDISRQLNGAPVVIVVGGGGDVYRTMTASSFKAVQRGRLRDLLGILQASIQIETLKHFGLISKLERSRSDDEPRT
jgi:uridylate kinase